MSSHRLDVAGQRQLQMTINDPAATVAWMPSKQGEDVELQLGGGVIRLMLPKTARIQRRRVTVKSPVIENNRPTKNDTGEFVYEESQEDRIVLVLGSQASLFMRSSNLDDPEAATGMYPHTNVVARRKKEEHYLEVGELVSEIEASLIIDTVLS